MLKTILYKVIINRRARFHTRRKLAARCAESRPTSGLTCFACTPMGASLPATRLVSSATSWLITKIISPRAAASGKSREKPPRRHRAEGGGLQHDVRVDYHARARDELKDELRRAGLDKHRDVVVVVAHLAAGHRCAKRVNGLAAQAIDEVWNAILQDALISVIVSGQHRVRAPRLI